MAYTSSSYHIQEAMSKIAADLNHPEISAQLFDLWNEYETQETAEVRGIMLTIFIYCVCFSIIYTKLQSYLLLY